MIWALLLRAAGIAHRHPRLTSAVLASLLLAGVWIHGDRNGAARERAAHEARTAALLAARTADAQRIIALADQLAEAQAERDEAGRRAEDAAIADDDAGRIALPARSVRRIDSR